MKRFTKFSAAAVALVACLVLGTPATAVRADVPTGPPVFSNPLNITNTFMPFQVGAMKVLQIKGSRTKEVVLDLYLAETRTLEWKGTGVTCRILREVAFEDGTLKEISDNYFAQADDGTVYYFGEVVDNYENAMVANHDGSWLVGGPALPSDPPETGVAPDPTVFMPANPEVGDVFKPEDLFPLVDETGEVKRVGVRVRVAAGAFEGAIEVEESSRLAAGTETKWYAPGVGVVKTRAKKEILELISTSFPAPVRPVSLQAPGSKLAAPK
jgi:hypothetical protein